MLNPSRDIVSRRGESYYPFGRSRPRNLFAGFTGVQQPDDSQHEAASSTNSVSTSFIGPNQQSSSSLGQNLPSGTASSASSDESHSTDTTGSSPDVEEYATPVHRSSYEQSSGAESEPTATELIHLPSSPSNLPHPDSPVSERDIVQASKSSSDESTPSSFASTTAQGSKIFARTHSSGSQEFEGAHKRQKGASTFGHDLLDYSTPLPEVTVEIPLQPSQAQISPPADPIKILVLRCYDLQSVLETLKATSQSNVLLHFSVNNSCGINAARNLLLLHIMLAGEVPLSKEDFKYLWDVWFSFSWTESTVERFKKDLIELSKSDMSIPGVEISDNIITSMKAIWKEWEDSVEKNRDHANRDNIHNQRTRFISKGFGFDFESVHDITREQFDEVVKKMDEDMSLANFPFYEQVGTTETNFYLNWLQHGNCWIADRSDEVCLNPTLLKKSSWNVHHSVNPLTDFIPSTIKDVVAAKKGDTAEQRLYSFCSNIFIRRVESLLTSKDRVQFTIQLDGPLEFCLSEDKDHYDVIDCSDLADEDGLANLLLATGTKLAQKQSSIVRTEVSKWVQAASNLQQFVEDALGVPLSMFPTIYAVHLATPVQLGASTPPDLRWSSDSPSTRTLLWRWTPPFLNVRLEHSDFMVGCLRDLSSKCFVTRRVEASDPSLMCTPQTFSYVLGGLARRTSDPDWALLYPTELPLCFSLAWKTLKIWQRQDETKPLVERQLRVLTQPMSVAEIRPFRLVLSLTELRFPLNEVGTSSCHYIDNVDVVVNDDRVESVTFLLAEEEDLKNKSLFCYLVDVVGGVLLASLQPFTVDDVGVAFSLSHPFSVKDLATQSIPVDWISCVETADMYKCILRCPYAGYYPIEDSRLPCQSVNQFKITEVDNVIFQFPHAFLDARNYSDLGEFTQLELEKSLEPSPEEFLSPNHQWDPEVDLTPIEHLSYNLGSIDPPIKYGDNLAVYLERQFSLETIEPKRTARNGVRLLFSCIFHFLLEHNKTNIIIYVFFKDPEVPDDATSPIKLWTLVIDRNVRMSPQGSPMLLVTAFDHQMPEQHKKSCCSYDVNDEAYTKLLEPFEFGIKMERKFFTRSRHEVALLRYALRYNSTMVRRSQWQHESLELSFDHPHSPWLITFLSPLYADRPVTEKQMLSRVRSKLQFCNRCGKGLQNENEDLLPCCPGCLSVFYCSGVCMDAHWNSQHKYLCHLH